MSTWTSGGSFPHLKMVGDHAHVKHGGFHLPLFLDGSPGFSVPTRMMTSIRSVFPSNPDDPNKKTVLDRTFCFLVFLTMVPSDLHALLAVLEPPLEYLGEVHRCEIFHSPLRGLLGENEASQPAFLPWPNF